MRTERLIESTERIIELTDEQATAIEAAGRRLVWSRGVNDGSVINCRALGSQRFAVRVADAVGIVGTPDVSLVVEPKIDIHHFLYLLERSERVPRLDSARAAADADASFWQLVARWYLDRLQQVVRRELLRDYRETEEKLGTVRGRILPVPTARSLIRGEPFATCRYEQYDRNNALNRLLKAAAIVIARSDVLPFEIRHRAGIYLRAFADVGDLLPTDRYANVARESQWYAEALTLARNVLDGQGRGLRTGEHAAWTFLFSTPLLIEEGVRRVLASSLTEAKITNSPLQLRAAGMSINPDIVVGNGQAVADVKYKLLGDEWNRPDLYQVVAFAAGFKTTKAALLGFATGTESILPVVPVGEIVVSPLVWRASPEITPDEAADDVARQAAAWIGDCGDASSASVSTASNL